MVPGTLMMGRSRQGGRTGGTRRAAHYAFAAGMDAMKLSPAGRWGLRGRRRHRSPCAARARRRIIFGSACPKRRGIGPGQPSSTMTRMLAEAVHLAMEELQAGL